VEQVETRTPFIRAPYSGYVAGPIPDEDAVLTHVGRGTPGGEYLRRFWHPVGFTHELKDLPLRMRALGEDLVLFRDKGGRIGLLHLHCSHRGTSLEFGLISERGIRCCYHGWLFDVDGRILEMPGEPRDSTVKDRLCHGAYPVREFNGLVFAYMGPPELIPPFPRLDSFACPGHDLVVGATYDWPCNWLQLNDNNMDPVHTAFLHTIISGAQFTEEYGVLPELDWVETPVGMIYVAARRVGDNIWVRVQDSMLPNLHQIGTVWENGRTPHAGDRPLLITWRLPIDDTHTRTLGFMNIPKSANLTAKDIYDRWLFGQTGERPYEDRQRMPGDYDAHVGQRPIAVHALEHLGTTDRGVVMLRKLLREGIGAVQRGEDPLKNFRDPLKAAQTYARNVVLSVPPGADADADKALLKAAARDVVAKLLGQPS
jgi:nitrite reductase/ring-hydroxylating ferredoxin subunit